MEIFVKVEQEWIDENTRRELRLTRCKVNKQTNECQMSNPMT